MYKNAFSALVAACCFYVSVNADATPIARYEHIIGPVTETCSGYLGANEADISAVVGRQELGSCVQACLQYCAYHLLNVVTGTDFNIEQITDLYIKVWDGDDVALENTSTNVDMCIAEGTAASSDPCVVAATTQACFRRVNPTPEVTTTTESSE